MVQKLIIAYDGTDDDAMARRMAVRSAHIALGDKLVADGNQLYGVAILNDAGDMIGSCCVMDFDTEAEFQTWYDSEPYITGNVWQRIELLPCRVGPSLQHLLPDRLRGREK